MTECQKNLLTDLSDCAIMDALQPIMSMHTKTKVIARAVNRALTTGIMVSSRPYHKCGGLVLSYLHATGVGGGKPHLSAWFGNADGCAKRPPSDSEFEARGFCSESRGPAYLAQQGG